MELIRQKTNCGCGFKRLIREEDNKVLLSGDYYHDKISERIDGYLLALAHNHIPFIMLTEEIKCPHDCDEE